MNLTGHWEGKYTYGKGYPSQYIGKSEPFELEIIDNDGTLSGTCLDQLVKAKEGNESYIIGSYKEHEIAFKKRYKFHFSIDESGSLVLEDRVRFDGVDYKGKLYKKFFSRKLYFSGVWAIMCEFKDENNLSQTFICKGTWKMSKTG